MGSKGTPGAKKQEAAVKETNGSEPRTITVRGTELHIPGQQPAEILFAARDAARAARTENAGAAAGAMLDMAIGYVGEDELRKLMAGASTAEGMKIVQEVLEAASNEYGTDTGESSASPES